MIHVEDSFRTRIELKLKEHWNANSITIRWTAKVASVGLKAGKT